MYFVLHLGIIVGAYIGFHFQEEIKGIIDAYDFFRAEESLQNTVLPEYLSKYTPKAVTDVLETMKFLFDLSLLRIEQEWSRTCTMVDANLFRVRFTIQQKRYAILVRPVRGPTRGAQFKNPDGEDLSEIIEPYVLGARAIISPVTPEMLKLGEVIDAEGSKIEPHEPLIVVPSHHL